MNTVGDNNTSMANSNGSFVSQSPITVEQVLETMMEKLQLRGPPQNPMNFSQSSYQMPSDQLSMQSLRYPLQYINPEAFRERLGQLPPVLTGQVPLRPTREDQYKTVMCEAWLAEGRCHYSTNCRFAHGEAELRPMTVQPRNIRKLHSKLCEKYTKNGICPYGNNCFFVHPNPNNPDNRAFFELNRKVHSMESQVLFNSLGYLMQDRGGFSASLPAGNQFFDGRSNALQNGLAEFDTISSTSTGLCPYPPPSLSTLFEQDPISSSLEPSSSSNNSDSLLSPSLKEQVLENLRKNNESEFFPQEVQAPKSDSDYHPFKFNHDFASSFSGLGTTFAHKN